MNRRAALSLAIATLLGAAYGGGLPFGGFGPPAKANPRVASLRDYSATLHTNLGDVALDLSPHAAPNAVQTFIRLAQRGAYDGLPVHAIFKDRMIVAGPAKPDAAKTIEREDSPLTHALGAVAMDRAADGRNTPTRLLLILSDQTHLDGDYTVFAEAADGREVLRRIASTPTRPKQGAPAPIEDIVIERVTVTRKKAEDSTQTTDR